jgi:hypothetical protein
VRSLSALDIANVGWEVVALTRILECNKTHALNMLAGECLMGYPWESSSTLAILVLIEAHWDVLCDAPILNQRGGPTANDVESKLAALSTVEPDTAMRYMTMTGGLPALEMSRLETRDGVAIAHEVLKVIAWQMMTGTELHCSPD